MSPCALVASTILAKKPKLREGNFKKQKKYGRASDIAHLIIEEKGVIDYDW